jgi:hypothetical protein
MLRREYILACKMKRGSHKEHTCLSCSGRNINCSSSRWCIELWQQEADAQNAILGFIFLSINKQSLVVVFRMPRGCASRSWFQPRFSVRPTTYTPYSIVNPVLLKIDIHVSFCHALGQKKKFLYVLQSLGILGPQTLIYLDLKRAPMH